MKPITQRVEDIRMQPEASVASLFYRQACTQCGPTHTMDSPNQTGAIQVSNSAW